MSLPVWTEASPSFSDSRSLITDCSDDVFRLQTIPNPQPGSGRKCQSALTTFGSALNIPLGLGKKQPET